MDLITRLAGGLYAITDGPRPDLLDVVEQALRGGARLLQYRDESRDTARRHEEAAAIRQLCLVHSVPLLVEEDVALARAIGADGVHLGGNAASVATARSTLGEHAIIGVACGNSLQCAVAAARSGASYISLGAFYPSPTKPLAPRASLELLRQTAALGLPRVAIGGITPDNAGSLIEAGADYVAAISALFGTPGKTADVARRFSRLFSSDRDSA